MSRLDVYTAVHKMQRRRLFDLTVAAGKADPSDPTVNDVLARAVDALVDELAGHAHHEEVFIHPKLSLHAPDVAEALESAHVDLDARLGELREVAAKQATTHSDPNTLYRALASFTSVYLGHLAVEEERALPALWRACTDDELQEILIAFRESRSDVDNLTSLFAQLPTMNPPEIARMVQIGLGAAPVTDVALLLSTVLSPHQLGALHAGLSPRANHS